MQILSTLALLAAVSATAVPEPRTAGAVPSVHFSKFHARSFPHSHKSVYDFTVEADSTTPKRAFKTKCSGTSNGKKGQLTPIFEGGCHDDSSVKFSLHPHFDGLVFKVYHIYDGANPNDYFNETASYVFPITNLEQGGSGNEKYEYIKGPHAFKASYVERTHVFIN